MTPAEAAWIAGIIEGEGYIGWKVRGPYGMGRIAVSMTDHDVIDRLHAWTGMGAVHTPKKDQPHHKQQWRWEVSAQSEFLALAELIEPWLLSRRAAKLREVRALLLDHQATVSSAVGERAKRSTRPGAGRCKRDHDKAVTGVRANGACVECHKLTNTKADREGLADAGSL